MIVVDCSNGAILEKWIVKLHKQRAKVEHGAIFMEFEKELLSANLIRLSILHNTENPSHLLRKISISASRLRFLFCDFWQAAVYRFVSDKI